MATVKSSVENRPVVDARPEPMVGDLLVTENGSVFLLTDENKVVRIAVNPENRGFIGEEFEADSIEELHDNLGEFCINPKGLVVTLTVA